MKEIQKQKKQELSDNGIKKEFNNIYKNTFKLINKRNKERGK